MWIMSNNLWPKSRLEITRAKIAYLRFVFLDFQRAHNIFHKFPDFYKFLNFQSGPCIAKCAESLSQTGTPWKFIRKLMRVKNVSNVTCVPTQVLARGKFFVISSLIWSILVHLGPLGSTWVHLGPLGSTWVNLGPLGLDPLGSSYFLDLT